MEIPARELAYERVKGRIALCCSILQCAGEVNLANYIGRRRLMRNQYSRRTIIVRDSELPEPMGGRIYRIVRSRFPSLW